MNFVRAGICWAIALSMYTVAPASFAQTAANAVSPGTAAANRLNLQQCIEIALKNNITIRQGQLQVENSALQLRQSRLNQYPTANFSGSQAFNSGRNVDPFTNQAVQQNINSSNYQLGTSVTVFNGFALKNQIKQSDLALQASQQELKATQNNTSITVAQNYLNVLTGQEQYAIAQRQAEVTQAQLDRTQRLVTAGTLPEANLYDLRAQLAQNQVDIVNAQNTLELAKVALQQAMNVPIQNIEVEPINVPDPSTAPYMESVQQIYETATSFLPDVQGADLRVRSAAFGVEAAKGSLYPSLSINGNLSTVYSSAARQRFVANGQKVTVPTSYFIPLPDGTQFQVLTQSPDGSYSSFKYFEQLQNNLNESVSLFLRVPIFGNFQARNRVTTARIQQQNAELNSQNIRLQLRQQIETAYTNMRAGANRYLATQAQVTSLERAFQAAESRFNAGALNATEYNIAKTNLDRARASLVQAKYDYVFRTKILDFFQNKPLTF